jgi:tRNA-uridine 2-sulfurtransferase
MVKTDLQWSWLLINRSSSMNKKSRKQNKVLIALSGGIDSAVSAVLLLRAGYQVEAAFMKNWSSTEGLLKNECPWLDDRREALKVAAHLQIPLHTFDFEKQYQERVMDYFFKEYSACRTPNPDVMCNKEIKFSLLYDKAIQMGFDYLATGHYAQIKDGRLVRSKDEFKDQTYFIYNIKKEQLNNVLFPVGGFEKKEIKLMARKFGLPNADRKESMGLCFVGKVQLDKFLAQKIKSKIGDIVDLEGKVVGQHRGVAFYTIGQRQGLGIGGSAPYYVMSKDIKTNTLVVSHDPDQKEFQTDSLQITNTNWLISEPKKKFVCQARFRHQQKLQTVTVSIAKDSDQQEHTVYEVKFKKPQSAVASGQSVVLYKGKVCLGGGVIV